jgi:ParB family chromosome partitioning protein
MAQIDAQHSNLIDVPIDLIDRNPENPRLIFRSGEMEELLESIRRFGVQVPISLYRDHKRYVLIDGERRWRCCLKLNKNTIPALVQEKPDPLTNLLLMFNIHALREQWDLLTVAVKLPRLIGLLKVRLSRPPTERELSLETGLKRGVIRRCKLLIELPQIYIQQMLTELDKPKSQQKLSEDFFIEMERSLKTVERAMPDLIKDKNQTRDVLIEKYQKEVIPNLVHLRDIGKIARAENVRANPKEARVALKKLFERNQYSIETAYRDSVSSAYSERDLLQRIESLQERLSAITPEEIDDKVRKSLLQLAKRIREVIGR